MRRFRWLGAALATVLVAAAIAAPTSSGGGAGSIAVSASLAGCGGSGGAVTCNIAVSFSSLPKADHYTATVTGPDGRIQGFGRVGPGSATLPVAYSGNGHYVVTISAWSASTRVGRASSSG